MGRKERRAKERQERKESIRMTPDRIYELKQKTANEAVRRVQEIEKGKEKQRAETALDMLLLFGMTYLHEQKGWGKQRLENYPMRRKTPCFSYGDIRRVHRIYASN